MSAASEARRVSSDASYSQSEMPYRLGGVVESPAKLTARSVTSFVHRGIDVLLLYEVVAIDPERQVVRVREVASSASTSRTTTCSQ